MPEEIKNLKDFVDFLYRYREFWGPGNIVFADPEFNSVAIEKSNCRMGVRWAKNVLLLLLPVRILRLK